MVGVDVRARLPLKPLAVVRGPLRVTAIAVSLPATRYPTRNATRIKPVEVAPLRMTGCAAARGETVQYVRAEVDAVRPDYRARFRIHAYLLEVLQAFQWLKDTSSSSDPIPEVEFPGCRKPRQLAALRLTVEKIIVYTVYYYLNK